MARVLGRVGADQGDACEADINGWAAAHGHVVVGWARELDGDQRTQWREGVGWERAPGDGKEARVYSMLGMRSWVEEWADRWDIIVATTPDRYTRDLEDITAFAKWCRENDKLIRTTSDGRDTARFDIWVNFSTGDDWRMVANDVTADVVATYKKTCELEMAVTDHGQPKD